MSINMIGDDKFNKNERKANYMYGWLCSQSSSGLLDPTAPLTLWTKAEAQGLGVRSHYM